MDDIPLCDGNYGVGAYSMEWLGAIQVLCNADGGGVRFSRKSVTKV